MRKSILACTVSVLMSPMAGWALGLGDIQVNSTLNQALKAEIELQSATKKDLESLHVGLASRKAYSRSNIEYNDYLKKFHFKVIHKNGKNYISITTRKPFKEPYANFLVEANWGSGRLLREYTMLVDPPEFVKAHSRAPSVATTSRAAQVKRRSGSSSSGKGKHSQPQYSGRSGELVYGPTQKNDTLWQIASNMAPANVSIDQMMMALLRDNPDAFVGNNINNLKAGYVLRIKDAASLNQLDRRSARRQVQEQYQAWKEARAQKVSTVSPVDRSDRSADKKAVNDGQLKLLASGESGSAGTQGSLASEASALKEKLAIASEELESKEIENQELKARIKELEEILKTKASLVQLKDESLAALQKQKELQENGVAEPLADEATEEPAEEPAETVEEQTLVESDGQTITEITVVKQATEAEEAVVDLEKEVQDESAGAALDKTTPITPVETVQPSTAEEAVNQTGSKKNAAKAKPEAVKKPQPKAKPKPKPAPVYQPTLLDDPVGFLLSSENLPYTAGGGGLLVLLLAWLGLRGRGKKKEAEFEESILDSQIAMDDSEFAADKSENTDDSSTEVLAADTETSFLSDFSSDDMESLQPDDTEADPIAEADVFMVYGRYQQAEELLKTAISKEPERIDYQMKLLEVYHGDNQKDAFAVQADVVRDLLSRSNDDYELTSEWTRAKSWAEKLGVDIEMPDSFDSEDAGMVSEEQDASSETGTEITADDLEATDEFSLDDVSDDLTLETTEIDFNDGDDSVLGDLDTDGSVAGDISDELSLDDLDVDSAEATEDSMNLDLDDLDTELSAESTESDMLNLEENTSETETEFELEDTETELNLEDLDTDEASMDLDDISDDELSLDSDELLDIESTDTETTETDTDENSLESEGSMELEDSLELGENLELDDSLEIEESSKDSSENLDAELADDSFELDMDKDAATSEDDLELLDKDMNFDELDDDFPELDAVGTKLDLAKAYIDMGDMESATSILNEVVDEGDDDQKTQARELLEQAKS